MDIAKRSASSYFDNGVEFMRLEDWPSATRAFRRAIGIDPNLAEANVGLGAAGESLIRRSRLSGRTLIWLSLVKSATPVPSSPS